MAKLCDQIFIHAQEKARQLGMKKVAPEVLFLSLLEKGDGLLKGLLKLFDVDQRILRREILKLVSQGPKSPKTPVTLLIKEAERFAQQDKSPVNSIHLFLSFVKEGPEALKKIIRRKIHV